jgi:predicted phosphodiesterase
MRILVVSDVHANAPAFEAVLRDAGRRGFDEALFLGDLVGYYPFTNECVALLRGLAPRAALRGNHDAVMLSLLDGGDESEHLEESVVVEVIARQVADLEPGSIEYLRSLSDEAGGDGWQAAHGAFRRHFEYLSTLANAQANLPYLSEPVGFVGHTHVPKVFASFSTAEGNLWRTVPFRRPYGYYRVPPRARAFLNPGSVGQPRDGISAASYGIFDLAQQSFHVHRVEYDIARVQRAVAECGYPASLGVRLTLGR